MNPQDKTISLVPMTRDMYHTFFREYQNARELYPDPQDYVEFVYDPQWVDAYVQRQIDRKRISLAILYGDEIIGEVKLYDIVDGVCATLGIALKNTQWTDRGFGTVAEGLAVNYVFHELGIPTLYADTVLTNTRSQHVLEKVGFQFLYADERKKYYGITKISY